MKLVITFFISLLFSFQSVMAQNNKVINDGQFKNFYKTGELKIEGQYKNKRRVGKWKNYHKNGIISRKYSYKNGNRNKEYISYYKDGTISNKTEKTNGIYINTGYYENGKLRYQRQVETGFYKSYFESGEVEIEANYLEYDLVGEWKKYYKNGQVEWFVTYKDGYRDGIYKHFYNNGDIKLLGNNTKNKVNGEEKRYLSNNLLEWEGKYDKGVLSKTWIKYNTNGKKIRKVKFKNGITTNKEFRDVLKPTKVAEGVFEHAPIYPGCEDFLTNKTRKKCMSKNITQLILTNFNKDIISSLGLKKGKQRIYVVFKIDKEGLIKDIKVKASHLSLQIEARRVIKLLPKLESGYQRGKPVIVPYSLPIVFMVK